ncbi:MAG: DUF4163 domain-containing protein [Cyclobacteriaceae bacterium]
MKNFKYSIHHLLFFLILGSCDSLKKETPNQTENEKTEEPTSNKPTTSEFFEMADFERKADNCESGSCSEVTVDYPRFLSAHGNSVKINKLVIKTINETISDFILEDDVPFNTTALANQFLASYADFKKNFPDSRTAWYLNVKATPTYISQHVVSVKFEVSSYSGGAHPNTTVRYLNVGKEGKEELKLGYFFKKPRHIKNLAEQVFRSQEGLAENDSYSDKGFIFDNDKFELSEVFGFDESGLIILYNPYEISSYSDGPTSLMIPFDQLEDNFKY